MKTKWLCFIFIFIYTFANAQTNLDSLYSVWQDKTQADSSRVSAFKNYIWNGYIFSQPDSALVFVDTLLKFVSEKNNKLGISTSLDLKGVAYYVKSDFSNALEYYQSSLKIKEEIGAVKDIANSLNNIAMIYSHQGENIKALEYYQKSLKIKEKFGADKNISTILTNIASIYFDLGDNIKALDNLIKSLKISEEIGDKQGIAVGLHGIGLEYFFQEDYPRALDYYQRSLKITEEIGFKLLIPMTTINIGLAHNGQGDYIKALAFLQKGLDIYEEIGDKKGISAALDNIASNYSDQNDNVKALEYYQRSLNIQEEIGEKKGIVISSMAIGQIQADQGNYIKAIEAYQKSYDLASEIGSILHQKNACTLLYNAYKALGNGNKALAYHEQMLVLNDSLKSEETAKKLQQMEFSKQVLADSLIQVEKDLKVEMVHQTEVRKKDKNKNIALGAGIFFLLLSGGFYSRWRYVKKSKAIIEKEKDRSENLLLNILPSEIAEELKLKGRADARDFDLVSILFTDFKGFTQAAEKLSANELIEEINVCFKAFDYICETYGIEKIKTIGDSYMAVGGLPVPSDDSIKQTILAALEMQTFITNRIAEKQAKNEVPFEMRLGIHTGPVVAGIVGVKKFQYDIWGDTVNIASRMESTGEIGKVNISKDTYEFLKDDSQFSFEVRGKIKVKGKGDMEMYFVTKII
ncbi:hypothetical protein A9Q87_06605 [Flavobacteriales bacterium 34_180_T64]|nr:hypothetical protein A9Q87_06605 [Flavobacteriales bacterium 34_180_T64]